MQAFPHFWNHSELVLPQCFMAVLCPGPHTLTSSLDFSFCNSKSPQGASSDALSKVAPPYSPVQLPIRVPLMLIILCNYLFIVFLPLLTVGMDQSVELAWWAQFRDTPKSLEVWGADKDFLLDQTLVRLLSLFLGQSVYFPVKSSFSKNPAKSI